MKKYFLIRKTGLAVVLAVMVSLIQVHAADMASASGVLAEISGMAVQAKSALAAAASSGDVDAIAKAAKQADAVDAILADAQAAYGEMEAAVASGDEAAADAAAAKLDAALQAAGDALNGDDSSGLPKGKGATNTGGSPGSAYDAPNTHDVPWQTEGLRSMYTSLFSSFFAASGGQIVSGAAAEADATKE